MSITNKNNQLELQILTRGLRRAQGFRLFFAQCNNRQLRTHIIKELESELIKQGITLNHLHLEHPVRSLDDLVPSSLDTGKKQVVSITGLENSLPLSEEKGDILQRLSYGRDLLPEIIPVPLVIWLSSNILKEIRTKSHDFWSWRAGVFYFQASPPKIQTSFTEIYRDILKTKDSIQQPLDNERMHIIYDLLEDLNLLPDTKKNKLQRAELLRQLGELHRDRSEYKRAEINFEEYLQILKEIGEDSRLLDAYYQLGTTKMLLSKSGEATTLFETALHHCNENKETKGLLHFLIGLEKRSKDIVGARKNFQQSLTFSREAGDKELESTLLSIFAEFEIDKKEYDKADDLFLNSIRIEIERRHWGALQHMLQKLASFKSQQQEHKVAVIILEIVLKVLGYGSFISKAAVLDRQGAAFMEDGNEIAGKAALAKRNAIIIKNRINQDRSSMLIYYMNKIKYQIKNDEKEWDPEFEYKADKQSEYNRRQAVIEAYRQCKDNPIVKKILVMLPKKFTRKIRAKG